MPDLPSVHIFFFSLYGNAILSRDPSWYTISFSRFYTHCLVFCFSMHSSPIVISCHCPFQSAAHTSIHLATTACTCIPPVLFYSSFYHLAQPPIPSADQSVTSASCDIFSWSILLAQAPVQVYYIGHFISPVHFATFLPFWHTPHCYHQLSSRTIIRFQA